MESHLKLTSNPENSIEKYYIKVIRDPKNNMNFIKLFELAEDHGDNWWFGAKNSATRKDYAIWAEKNSTDLSKSIEN